MKFEDYRNGIYKQTAEFVEQLLEENEHGKISYANINYLYDCTQRLANQIAHVTYDFKNNGY